eukprot:scaffold2477_cov95-Isochrysis_galbana.AAC.2
MPLVLMMSVPTACPAPRADPTFGVVRPPLCDEAPAAPAPPDPPAAPSAASARSAAVPAWPPSGLGCLLRRAAQAPEPAVVGSCAAPSSSSSTAMGGRSARGRRASRPPPRVPAERPERESGRAGRWGALAKAAAVQGCVPEWLSLTGTAKGCGGGLGEPEDQDEIDVVGDLVLRGRQARLRLQGVDRPRVPHLQQVVQHEHHQVLAALSPPALLVEPALVVGSGPGHHGALPRAGRPGTLLATAKGLPRCSSAAGRASSILGVAAKVKSPERGAHGGSHPSPVSRPSATRRHALERRRRQGQHARPSARPAR